MRLRRAFPLVLLVVALASAAATAGAASTSVYSTIYKEYYSQGAINLCAPTLVELEVMHIRRALEASHGHRNLAARILGISERNLYRKLKEHRLLG